MMSKWKGIRALRFKTFGRTVVNESWYYDELAVEQYLHLDEMIEWFPWPVIRLNCTIMSSLFNEILHKCNGKQNALVVVEETLVTC